MTVPTVVLDTSVIVKWVRQEEVLAKEALDWRTRFLDGEVQFAVPFLLTYELANVLVNKPDLSTGQVSAALRSVFDMGIDWIEPCPSLLLRSTVMARKHEASAYDATFAALAEGCKPIGSLPTNGWCAAWRPCLSYTSSASDAHSASATRDSHVATVNAPGPK